MLQPVPSTFETSSRFIFWHMYSWGPTAVDSGEFWSCMLMSIVHFDPNGPGISSQIM